MNSSFQYGELERQVEYEAAWEGGKVPVLTLTKGETRGTSMDCPRCGERLLAASRDDDQNHYGELRCNKCERWSDRDVVAVMNISHRGLLRFGSPKGEAGEAVNGDPEKEWSSLSREPAIPRVDASKLRVEGLCCK
jgi:transposase